jgi:hypothetical protein
MKRTLMALATVLALAAVSCSKDSTSPRAPSLTGTWSGTLASYAAAVTMTEGSRGSITGNATLTAGVQVLGLSVTGTHTHPSVTLTLGNPQYYPAIFSGTMTDQNDIRGMVNGSGFALDSLTLVRQ